MRFFVKMHKRRGTITVKTEAKDKKSVENIVENCQND